MSNTDNGKSGSEEAKRAIDSQNAGISITCGVIIYIVVFALLLLYSIVQFWPASISTGNGTPSPSNVTFLLWTFPISEESRMILIIAMAGSLGSLIHTFRSAIKYIGQQDFKRSWLAFYILLPYIGGVLGLIFYFVIRGGFFAAQTTVQQTNPFGFAALSGLVGLFSEQAVSKLKAVFEQLLTKVEPGKDHYKESKEKKVQEDAGKTNNKKASEDGDGAK